MNEFFELIAKKKPEMSKSHRKLADYILENKTQVSFLNITTLASLSDTSEATIVRFCTVLGYKGYPQLRQELQNALQQKITMQDRLTMSKDIYADKEGFLNKIISDDASRVQNVLNNLDTQTFFSVSDCLVNAKKICIVAGRSSTSLARFMQYYFNLIFDDVVLITSTDEASEKYNYFDKDTVVFGITFSRYTKSTIKIMQYAKNQNCTTIGMTDSHASPLAPFCNYLFLAETNVPSILDTYVAPLTIINALISYLCTIQDKNIHDNIQKAELMWKTFDIFDE